MLMSDVGMAKIPVQVLEQVSIGYIKMLLKVPTVTAKTDYEVTFLCLGTKRFLLTYLC